MRGLPWVVRGRFYARPLIGKGIEAAVEYQIGKINFLLLVPGDHLNIAVISLPGKRNIYVEIADDIPACPLKITRELRGGRRSRRV
ncbi:MAG TPA: hypothetical protein VJV40_01095 [Thermodesulfobacteriota bacterium]|nr:hypothetical protein [Thermodesulfobacteriota bacterium]